jgi:hypothetical protein
MLGLTTSNWIAMAAVAVPIVGGLLGLAMLHGRATERLNGHDRELGDTRNALRSIGRETAKHSVVLARIAERMDVKVDDQDLLNGEDYA